MANDQEAAQHPGLRDRVAKINEGPFWTFFARVSSVTSVAIGACAAGVMGWAALELVDLGKAQASQAEQMHAIAQTIEDVKSTQGDSARELRDAVQQLRVEANQQYAVIQHQVDSLKMDQNRLEDWLRAVVTPNKR